MVTLNSQQKKLNLTKNKNKGHEQFQLWTTINFRLIDRTSPDGHKYDRGCVTSTGLEVVLDGCAVALAFLRNTKLF